MSPALKRAIGVLRDSRRRSPTAGIIACGVIADGNGKGMQLELSIEDVTDTQALVVVDRILENVLRALTAMPVDPDVERRIRRVLQARTLLGSSYTWEPETKQ